MAKTKIILHKTQYSNGKFPLMMRVTHNRKAKFIALGIECHQKQWNKDTSKLRRNFEGYKSKNQLIKKLETRAENIIDNLTKDNQPFTFQTFEKEFLNKPKQTTVFTFLDSHSQALKDNGKINTGNVYKQTLNSLQKFHKKKDLMFEDINYKFLKKYEAYLYKNGCSGGGIHFYMRTLRATLNEAIKQGYLKKEYYPFSTQFNKNGYSLKDLKSKASPRALSDADMEKIKAFPTNDYPELKESLYYFLFSYYSRGMNFNDMAKLKKTDIYNNRIRYFRSKTSKMLTIGISDPIMAIMEYFKENDSIYLFPILNENIHIQESQMKNRIRKCLKIMNADLKAIAEILHINTSLTSYVARHTYATRLKRNGIDISVISEGLGHSDISTTRAYLNKFDNKVIDEADKVL